MGYFHTGAHTLRFSRDHGVTWIDENSSREVHRNVIAALSEGELVDIELGLDTQVPIDEPIDGTELGRFVLLDANRFAIFGGLITEST